MKVMKNQQIPAINSTNALSMNHWININLFAEVNVNISLDFSASFSSAAFMLFR